MPCLHFLPRISMVENNPNHVAVSIFFLFRCLHGVFPLQTSRLVICYCSDHKAYGISFAHAPVFRARCHLNLSKRSYPGPLIYGCRCCLMAITILLSHLGTLARCTVVRLLCGASDELFRYQDRERFNYCQYLGTFPKNVYQSECDRNVVQALWVWAQC